MGIVATGAITAGSPEKITPASKFISLLEYDPQNRTLDITFKSGSKHRYLWISPITMLSLKTSPTIDAFYTKGIKGVYTSIKLVDAGIGRDKSSPLKKVKQENHLNAGLRKQPTGTVARAFAA